MIVAYQARAERLQWTVFLPFDSVDLTSSIEPTTCPQTVGRNDRCTQFVAVEFTVD